MYEIWECASPIFKAEQTAEQTKGQMIDQIYASEFQRKAVPQTVEEPSTSELQCKTKT